MSPQHQFCRTCNAAGHVGAADVRRWYHEAHAALKRARRQLARSAEVARQGHMTWAALLLKDVLEELFIAQDARTTARAMRRAHGGM